MINNLKKLFKYSRDKYKKSNNELVTVFWFITSLVPFISVGLFFLLLIIVVISIFAPIIAISTFFANVGVSSSGIDEASIGKNTPIPSYCYKKDHKVFCEEDKMSKKDKALYDSLKTLTKNYDYKHPIALDWSIAIDYQNFLDNRYKDFNIKKSTNSKDNYTLDYKRLKAINDFRQDDVLEQANDNEERKNDTIEMSKNSFDNQKEENKFFGNNTLLLIEKEIEKSKVSSINTAELNSTEQRLATLIFENAPKEYKKTPLVAGILANMKAESSLNYKASNGGKAFGLFQWLGSRKEKLLRLHPIDKITEQDEIQFFWSEFQDIIKQHQKQFTECKSGEDFAKFIDIYYERSELTTTSKRQEYAKNFASKLSHSTSNIEHYKQTVPIGLDDIASNNKEDINEAYLKILRGEKTNIEPKKLKDFQVLIANLKRYYKIQYNLNNEEIYTKIKEVINYRKLFYHVVLDWISNSTPKEENSSYSGDVPASDGFIYPFRRPLSISSTQHFFSSPSVPIEPLWHGVPTHRGVDWGFGDGSTTTSYTPEPIYAPTNLKIIRTFKDCIPTTRYGCGGGLGNYIYGVFKYKEHDYVMIFGHNSKILVNVNDEVKMGQKIAEGGNSGNSVGSHSHIEIQTIEHYNKYGGNNNNNDLKSDYLDAEKLFGNQLQLDKLKN